MNTYRNVILTRREWSVILSALGIWNKIEGSDGTKASKKVHKKINIVENKIFKQIR